MTFDVDYAPEVLHSAATRFAQSAAKEPDRQLATRLYYKAYKLALTAAERANNPLMYRDAAHFALRAGLTEESRRLALEGLDLYPTEAVADDLWRLMSGITPPIITEVQSNG